MLRQVIFDGTNFQWQMNLQYNVVQKIREGLAKSIYFWELPKGGVLCCPMQWWRGTIANCETEPLIGAGYLSADLWSVRPQSTQQGTGVPAPGQGWVQPEGRVTLPQGGFDVAPGRPLPRWEGGAEYSNSYCSQIIADYVAIARNPAGGAY